MKITAHFRAARDTAGTPKGLMQGVTRAILSKMGLLACRVSPTSAGIYESNRLFNQSTIEWDLNSYHSSNSFLSNSILIFTLNLESSSSYLVLRINLRCEVNYQSIPAIELATQMNLSTLAKESTEANASALALGAASFLTKCSRSSTYSLKLLTCVTTPLSQPNAIVNEKVKQDKAVRQLNSSLKGQANVRD